MIRKILYVMLLSLLPLSSYAINQDEVNNIESEMIENLEETKSEIEEEYNSLKNDLEWNEEYLILNNLWEIDITLIREDYIDDFLDIEEDILEGYSDIRSQIRWLNRSFEFERISQEEYDDELDDIEYLVETESEIFSGDINEFWNKYNNRLEDFEDEFESLVEEKESVIEEINQNLSYIEEIINEFEQLNSEIDKVNEVYLWSSWTVHEFLEGVEKETINSMEKALEVKAENYYQRYVNLKPNAKDDIKDRKETLILRYESDFNEEFEEILEWFYSREEYNQIKEEVENIRQVYGIGEENPDYEAVKNIGDYEEIENLIEKNMNSIEEKKDEFDYAQDWEELEESLTSRVENFYKEKEEKYLTQLENFLEKELDLIRYKTSQESERYIKIEDKMSDIEEIENNSEKLEKIDKLIEDIEEFRSEWVVDVQIKNNLEEDYYHLEYDRIDLVIRDEGLLRYNINYPNIKSLITNVLDSLEEEYENEEVFIDSLEVALDRIDEFLEEWIQWEEKFLMLRIKEWIIDYLYL